MINPEKWYSVKEVAAILSVGVDSVRRWIRARKLRAFKMPKLSSKRKRIFESFRILGKDLLGFIGGQVT